FPSHSLLLTIHSLSFFSCSRSHRDLHSFPTRRSSDLQKISLVHAHATALFPRGDVRARERCRCRQVEHGDLQAGICVGQGAAHRDRKSTRLNSSHSQISYAVFCLKKKKRNKRKNTEYS